MKASYDLTQGADRLKQSQVSSIRVILDKVSRMEEQGMSFIKLNVGEPDLNTPEHIKQATIDRINRNFTHYTSNRGEWPFLKEIEEFAYEETGVRFNHREEIVCTCGGSEALSNVIQGHVNEGDEVIIPTPCYPVYLGLVYKAGGIPIQVPLDENNEMDLDIDAIRAAITDKTKMVFINNPSNPIGTVFSEEKLAELAKLAVEHNFLILSDEMYARLIYDGRKFHSMISFPEMRKHAIIANGFSKCFAMTGWRMGYVLADKSLIGPCLKAHQFESNCLTSFIEYGLADSMNAADTKADMLAMVDIFDQRRKAAMEILNTMENVKYVEPRGAFYIFANVGGLGMDGDEFAERLLQEKHVVVVPGQGFGSDFKNYIRIAYTNDIVKIREGMRLMAELVAEINAENAAKA